MSNGMEIQLADVSKHGSVLAKQQEELDKWCSTSEVRGEALIRYALAEISVNHDLRACTPTSIYLALLACGVTGLVPGKLRGHSFLVPFGNTHKDAAGKEYRVSEATFMMGWRGVKYIGYRSGIDLVSAVIREHDDFDFDKGTAAFVRFKPALKGGGRVIGAAAWAKLPRGNLEVEYLNSEELEKIKQAATRIRKSPAWDGPFRDQMERKSALKRLGKQTLDGEEFFKASLIEQAQDDHGDAAAALDQLTDGAATRFLGRQSAEAAAFGHLPRPAQAQIPAGDTPVHALGVAGPVGTAANAPKLQTATNKARAADKARTPPPAATPTSPTPAAASNGSASPPASAATPAANLPPASNTAPPPSTASTSSSISAAGPGAEAPAGPSRPSQDASSEFGDVASEPKADDDFDTSFGDDSDDPVDRTPTTRADWIEAFQRWAAAHPTRDSVLADESWLRIFQGWAAACTSKEQLDEDKPIFIQWTRNVGLTSGRKVDPAKGVAAVPPDRPIVMMQDAFLRRYQAVP